ncbi:uncharacterized protein PHACADRAFT_252191 [Phanerochaete carnosa HHB-10118-sp]|uniref:Uncharacterized protein n=1 Tax=Phanerochaete carnosa (strain HHB-10118-sp) TaxID=650164 RepID=K5W2M4_PHACS|nr:uncharacterized protein PHACADRAFT_252191 [Phanerochaete carnosa HHB-10118-sp]EKM58128.1 hypothetical protein PHACADRAFT_252191 [Phanerochaete carnosa HHB-10118-sp]
MQDLFDNVWGDKDEIRVEHAVDITLPVSTSLLHHLAWTLLIASPLAHSNSSHADFVRSSLFLTCGDFSLDLSLADPGSRPTPTLKP